MLSSHLLKSLSHCPFAEKKKYQSCSLDKDFVLDSLRPLHMSECWFSPCHIFTIEGSAVLWKVQRYSLTSSSSTVPVPVRVMVTKDDIALHAIKNWFRILKTQLFLEKNSCTEVLWILQQPLWSPLNCWLYLTCTIKLIPVLFSQFISPNSAFDFGEQPLQNLPAFRKINNHSPSNLIPSSI